MTLEQITAVARSIAQHLPGGARRWRTQHDIDVDGKPIPHRAFLVDQTRPGYGVMIDHAYPWRQLSVYPRLIDWNAQPRTQAFTMDRSGVMKSAGMNPQRSPDSLAADIARRVLPRLDDLVALVERETEAAADHAQRLAKINRQLSDCLDWHDEATPSGRTVRGRKQFSAEGYGSDLSLELGIELVITENSNGDWLQISLSGVNVEDLPRLCGALQQAADNRAELKRGTDMMSDLLGEEDEPANEPAPPVAAAEPSSQAAGRIVAQRHTRRRVTIYTVELGARVSRETFDRLRALAGTLGGYYSRSYRGSVAGFTFTTRDAAEQFCDRLRLRAEATPLESEAEGAARLAQRVDDAAAGDPGELAEPTVAVPIEGEAEPVGLAATPF